jgi:hypothetical protein
MGSGKDFVKGFCEGMGKGGASPPGRHRSNVIVRYQYIRPYIKGLLEPEAIEYKKKKPGKTLPGPSVS